MDLSTVILDRLVPAGISHLDAFVEASRGGTKRGRNAEVETMKHLRAHDSLHVALQSRDEETNYLRGLISALYPYVIPIKYQDSP